KRKIEKLSWGLALRMTDLVLLQLFLGLTLIASSKHSGKFLAGILKKIHNNFDEEKIKRAFYELKKGGFVEYGKRLWLNPQITKEGKRRLADFLPQYDPVRTWDKRLYLITYDIPEKERKSRDQLRRFLQKIGCGLLQESLWITPYNPKKVINEYVAEAGLEKLILISDMGKDGEIGQEDIRELINRVYGLDKLNERWREFINKAAEKKYREMERVGWFSSILKDDPQLPFELLPDNWQGEKAWQIVKPLLKNNN
ncbi:MAG: CRISPR-associated endonuclease Cas2, partial [Patescibacteria group bacterium]|nr:CRISPR-associated endonuclease Cas2 [Patescibacteria group bacterium]